MAGALLGGRGPIGDGAVAVDDGVRPEEAGVLVDGEAGEDEELIAPGGLQRVHVRPDDLRSREQPVVVDLVDAAHQLGDRRVVGLGEADAHVAVVLGERQQIARLRADR